jgi:hypothetical protein
MAQNATPFAVSLLLAHATNLGVPLMDLTVTNVFGITSAGRCRFTSRGVAQYFFPNPRAASETPSF